MVVGRRALFFTDVGNRRLRAVDRRTGVIRTVAGGGDDGPQRATRATEAALSSHPMRVTRRRDALFVSDTLFHRIRRIDGGIISTVAGTGVERFSGDGDLATRAALAEPHGAAFDGGGHLYIADSRNHRIRRVDARSGRITTVAGTGHPGAAGDGGPAVAAQLSFPLAVAFDADGHLFVVDTDNGRVRRVDARSGRITTVAGNGELGPVREGVSSTATPFGRLRDLAITSDGDLILCDGGNSTILRFPCAGGPVRRVAGTGDQAFSGDGGAATRAALSQPYSIALDEGGNLFIKDCGNHRIRRVDAVTGRIDTVAGNGERGDAGDCGPAVAASLAVG